MPNPPPVGSGELPATDPSIPGMNMTDVSPDRNDPFPNRSFADILTSIEEGSTGSIHDRRRGQQLSGPDRQPAVR